MRTVISFLFACLVLGFALSWFGVTPSSLGVWLADSAQKGWETGANFFRWGGGYIAMGAMVLVPFLAIRWLLRRRR